MDNSCRVRKMIESDGALLSKAFCEQGWRKEESQLNEYFLLQQSKKHTVLVAEWERNPVGYLIVRPEAQEGPFAMRGIPELVDFNVLIQYQHRGFGNTLMEVAEEMCQQAGCVSLAVGLHSGYGQAQRIYVKRGYLFDGSGTWYQGKQLEQYAPCYNDDDLVLYMIKEL